MQALNLPTYSFKIKSEGNIRYIFDKFRKKYIKLTPEEWVRQNFLCFLEKERGYPASKMVVEKSMHLYGLDKRADVLVYDSFRMPKLLAECKAPDILISNDVFQQIAAYNMKFKVEYLVVTNGLQHYCCRLNFTTGEIVFMNDIPAYKDINPAT